MPVTRISPATVARPAFARWLSTTNDITKMFLSAGRVSGLINMAGGLPDAALYPAAELAELARRAVADHPAETLGYSPIDGLPELRDALAARFSSGALQLSRQNVLVTSGGMQGLDLIGKVLLEPGGLIAAQFPTYLGALDAWRPYQPAYRPINLEGNDVNPVAALSGAQFGYAVPNFSNPTGRLVGLAMRQRLVEAALLTGTWLVEDDPYGTLTYDGAPLPRMITLAAEDQARGSYDGPIVHMGTLSKEIVPGLRIGWVIAAPAMIQALTLAKQGADMCTSGLTQRVALEALNAGLIERLHATLIERYRARRNALCAAMAEHLASWFEWEVPVGGMFVWAVARSPHFDTDRLLQEALKVGVCVAPSSVFDLAGSYRRAIRVNFTLNPPDLLVEGVRRLAIAVRAMEALKD